MISMVKDYSEMKRKEEYKTRKQKYVENYVVYTATTYAV